MKTFYYCFACFAAGLLIATSRGQTFQNLDFEQGSITVPPPAQLSSSVALPGWKVWLNGAESSTILYDAEALDLWSATIYDSASIHTPISGRYTVLIKGGRDQFGNLGDAAVSQTGTIPPDARSMLFAARINIRLDVSANGSLLPLIPLATHPTFTTYGVDVSGLAGQTEEIRFSAPSNVSIDDIQFSSQVIPEPSMIALLAAGAVVAGAGLKSQSSKRCTRVKSWTAVLAACVCHSRATMAQGFQNLDFESAVINPTNGGSQLVADALPYWTVLLNDAPPSNGLMFYDGIAGGGPMVSIHDSKSTLPPISGLFSIFIQSGRSTQGNGLAATIAQTGTIAANSRTLLFTSDAVSPLFTVSFKGESLPLYDLGPSGSHKTFGADISSFAGQTGELRFTAPFNAGTFMDDIRFSTQVIPEPSTFALLAAGAALFTAAFLSRCRK
jgi:hypothetical protein